MKRKLYLTVAFVLQVTFTLYAQSFTWAHNFGGTDNDVGTHLATDASGNTYVTGYFNGTAFFDPALINSLGGEDAFLVKYNAAGNVQWATTIGGTGNDEGTAICVDPNGNIYVAGVFASPTISIGATTLTNSGGDDIFFLKYNSGGVILNAVKAGGAGFEKCLSICANASGELYATGYIAGTTACSFGSITITGTGVSSMFIAKYDASLVASWAQKAGGLGALGNVRGTSIALDFAGAPFVVGYFLSGADFVVQQFTAIGNTDMFLARYYSNNGNLNAAYQYSGSSAASRINPTALKMDGSGFCNVAGYFVNNAVLGTATLTSNGLDDIFITRINAVGNVQWAVSAGGAAIDRATGLAIDALGNYYISGYLDGSFNFGSIPASGNSGSPDVFVAKYSGVNSAWEWALTGGTGSGYEYAYDIAYANTSNLVITGQSDATFTLGAFTIDNAGLNDGFVAGISTLTGINDLNNENAFAVAPNPANDLLHITFATKKASPIKIELLNTTGTAVFMHDVKSFTGNSITLDLSKHEIENGIYFLKVSNGKSIHQQKIIIAH